MFSGILSILSILFYNAYTLNTSVANHTLNLRLSCRCSYRILFNVARGPSLQVPEDLFVASI